jgi:ethanolamine utilization protein EutM
MKAIGLIETRGLTAAIEALDSMAKAANITLVDMKRVGSGLVTVVVEGDVSDVTAAIEVGKEAHLKTGGEMVSYNVIARPHPELAKIL